MKTTLLSVLTLLVVAVPATAQAEASLGVRASFLFDAEVAFRSAGFGGQDPGPDDGTFPAGGRQYANGHVSPMPAPMPTTTQTLVWGYDDAATQVTASDTIAFTAYQADVPTSAQFDDDPHGGAELVFDYALGERTDSFRWGVRVLGGYRSIGVRGSLSESVTATTTTDEYPIPGGLDQATWLALYPDTSFASLGFGGTTLSGVNNPTRTQGTTTATYSLQQNFKADAWSLAVGPFAQFGLGEVLAIRAAVYGTVVTLDMDALVQERLTDGTTEIFSFEEAVSDDDTLFGILAEFAAIFHLDEAVALEIGLGYGVLGSTEVQVGDGRLELDLDESLSVSTGILFRY